MTMTVADFVTYLITAAVYGGGLTLWVTGLLTKRYARKQAERIAASIREMDRQEDAAHLAQIQAAVETH